MDNTTKKSLKTFKSVWEDEETRMHWETIHDYSKGFQKNENFSNKISNAYRFFKLFNKLNKGTYKNSFLRQFNFDYVKKRHAAIIQAINFVRLKPHDEANLKVLRDEACKKNVIEHVLEIDNRQLEVPDMKDESKFIKTTARNKVRVKIEKENCTKPFKR